MIGAGRTLLPLFLFLFLSEPAPAPAESGRAIPCDPPLDRDLKLVMRQDFTLENGAPASVEVTRTLRFTRDGKGISVTGRIAGVEAISPDPAALARLRLAYGLPGDAPVVIRLDAAMGIARVESLDTLWQDFRRRQDALGAAMAKGGSAARARALAASLDAMDEAQRVVILSAFLTPVLRHCGTVAPADAQWLPDGAIGTETRTDTGDTRDVEQYRIDGRTGLLRTLDRTLTNMAAALRPLREHWTLEPAE